MARRLEKAYAEYNRKYFKGRLPKVRVQWSEELTKQKWYGDFNWEFTARRGGKVYMSGVIRIATWLKPHWREWNLTLIHEMAHVSTRNLPDEAKALGDKHSTSWQREMKRLANAGAFTHLW